MSVKIERYPGHGLTREEFNAAPKESWRPSAKYAWSAGVAIGRFLEELKNGRIIGRKCFRCGRIMVPPRMYCEWCFRPTDEWVYVKDTGKINTYSISYLAADSSWLETPVVVGVIELDGASPGMGILHYIGEVDIEEAKAGRLFGVRVKAVWKPPEERKGSITDIKYFKPIMGV